MYTACRMASYLILLLTLSACGGSNKNNAPPAPSPNGIYSGSIASGSGGVNGNERAVIYDNQLIVISEPGGIQQVFNANLTVNNLTLSASGNESADYYDNATPRLTTMTLTGSFIAGQSATINFTDNTAPSAIVPDSIINLTADTALFNRGSAAATVQAVWTGMYAGFGTMTITINADGSFTGSDLEACNYTGTVTPADASVNVYNVTLTSTGGAGCGTVPAGTYTGLAWTEGASDGTLVFSVADGTNSRSILMTK